MISKSKLSIGYNEISYKTNFLNYLILYSLFLPVTLTFISIIQRFIIKRKFENFFKKQDKLFKINNLKSLENLSIINYILFDKTGTLTNGNISIKALYINEKMYSFNEDKENPLKLPKIIKIKPQQNFAQTKSIKFENSEHEIPAEAKLNDEKPQVRDFFNYKPNSKQPSSSEKIFAGQSSSIHIPQKISLEIENFESMHPNVISPKRISIDLDEEIKILNIDNKFLLSPDLRSSTKKKVKESMSFSMRMSKYQSKTFQTMKNNAFPEFEELNELNFQSDLQQGEPAINAMKSLILCHNAKSLIRDGNTLKFYHTNDEMEIMKFCSKMSFKFERIAKLPDNKIHYLIEINGVISEYDVIGINHFSKKKDRNRFSIVLKDIEKDKTVLYSKGSTKHMINLLELDEKKKNELMGLIRNENNKGRRALIYSIRELNEQEAEEYQRKYSNLHSNFSVEDDKIQEFYCEMEVKLRLLCIVFMEDCLRPSVLQTVKLFYDLNLKIWILTGDTFERTLSSAYLTKILHVEDNLSVIKCSSLSEAQLSIKNELKNLKKLLGFGSDNSPSTARSKKHSTVYNQANLCVIIDGNSLDVILNNESLSDHFFFIAYFCKALIAYRLTPYHKAILAKKIKEKFINEALSLAIGDGYNDNLMFEASDASISISDKINDNNKANIQISEFGVIPNLLINCCHLVWKIEDSYQFLYSSFCMFFLPNFFFAWYNNFNGSGIYKNPLVFFVYFVQSAIFSLFFCFFPMSKKDHFTTEMRLKYRLHSSLKSRIIAKFLIFGALLPVVQVIQGFYLVFYTITYFFDSNGFDTTLDTIEAMLLVSFFTMNTINVKKIIYIYIYPNLIFWHRYF